MALPIYTSSAFTGTTGVEVAANASVEVRSEADDSLVTLYSDRAGTVQINNPFQADEFGRFEFFANPNSDGWRITVTSGADSHMLRYQQPMGYVGGLQESDNIEVTATGASAARTLADHLADVMSVSGFASLEEAVTEIGATETTLRIDKAVAPASNVTIPSTLALVFTRDGRINPASGVTVTINGHVDAGAWQIFGGAGTIAGAPLCAAFRLEWFGGGEAAADNTAALNAVAALMSGGATRTLKVGPGNHVFNSKPSDFTTGIIIEGEGMSFTTLVRGYSEAGPDTGFLTWTGSGSTGGGIRHCQVAAATGTTGGTMLKFTTTADDIAGFHQMHEVVVSHRGTGTYERALYVDGVLNDVSGSQGLRDFRGTNSYLFKGDAGIESARFRNATNLMLSGVWANGQINVTGGGTALTNTTDAKLNVICLSTLQVENSINVYVSGIVNALIFTTGSEECHFNGQIQTLIGGFTDIGTNNYISTLKPWKTYTPTVTAGSGTFTSVSATGRYIKEGRIVHVQIRVVITTNGTAATSVNASLPVASSATAGTERLLAGREVTSSGNMLQGYVGANASVCVIRAYDNAYPGADGRTLFVSGSYEVD